MAKLAAVAALFLLVLSVGAFASPLELGSDEGVVGRIGEVDRTDLIAEHEQKEEKFTLYLGPQEEEVIIKDADDRRVN